MIFECSHSGSRVETCSSVWTSKALFTWPILHRLLNGFCWHRGSVDLSTQDQYKAGQVSNPPTSCHQASLPSALMLVGQHCSTWHLFLISFLPSVMVRHFMLSNWSVWIKQGYACSLLIANSEEWHPPWLWERLRMMFRGQAVYLPTPMFFMSFMMSPQNVV